MNSFKMQIPEDVKTILNELSETGHSAYIVGGVVRDAVMGKIPHDYDICTSASPEEMLSIFRHRHVIETGLKHGTLTVLGKENQYEITTYRIDGDYGDHRHPKEVTFVDNIEEDLSRRDLTINAMAYNETAGLVDPFGGAEDVKHQIIRCVGDPDKRFAEDALRILRAVRFSSVCGFSIEKNTQKAMFRHQELLENVSAERKNTEFCKLLVSASADLLLTYKDIFATFIPELRPTFFFDQHNFHHQYDVYEHSIRAVAAAPHDLIIRLALFFHDIGKPATYTVDENGVGHFYGHAEISAQITKKILKRLKFDNNTVSLVTELVKAHGLVPVDSLKYARRLLNRHGEDQMKRLLTVARCDIGAQAPYAGQDSVLQKLAVLEEQIKTVIAEKQCVTVKNLDVNGKDIMELGVKEGKKVGEILQMLLETVLDSPEKNEKEILLALAKETLS